MHNYNILTLGPSGAGKTVFLASLFKSLSIQGESGFFLKVEDDEKRNLLNKIYTELVSGEKWPAGTTGAVKKWTFTCCIKTPELDTYPACQFTYIDYAGKLLTEMEEEQGGGYDFDSAVNEADAVLAILDGFKVLAFMQDQDLGSRDVINWMQKDIPNIMQLVDNCGKHTPVHFLISKWDLIEGKYTLFEVRNRLLEKVREFKKVVRNRSQASCPIRLIPISSVGMEFATLQNNGEMKKKPGAVPHPFQVEVPLACVLTDGLKVQLEQVKLKKGEVSQRSTEVKPDINTWRKAKKLFSDTVLSASTVIVRQFVLDKLPEKYKVNNDVLRTIVNLTEKGVIYTEETIERTRQEINEKKVEAARTAEKLLHSKTELLTKVTNEESALNYAVMSFLYVQNRLVEDFAASDLNKAGV